MRRCGQRSDTVNKTVYEATQKAIHEAVQEEHFKLMNHPMMFMFTEAAPLEGS